MSLYFRIEEEAGSRQAPIEIVLPAADTADLARDILDVHRQAWRDPARGPLDREPGEQRPRWL
ncbi:hypothetical protein D3C81_2262260 [compost metagenome]